jgi:hypothetical protein
VQCFPTEDAKKYGPSESFGTSQEKGLSDAMILLHEQRENSDKVQFATVYFSVHFQRIISPGAALILCGVIPVTHGTGIVVLITDPSSAMNKIKKCIL